ncbi:MAG TPA: hypothetical protein VFS28_02225, partial [Gemmatimonadales bacterium]|nr:hypothetical protein [Gemmatimonadales bacterium]
TPRAPEFHPAAPAPADAGILALRAPSGGAEEGPGLAGSFATYARLTRERPAGTPSVEAFIAPGATPAPAIPAPAPAPVVPAPAPVAAPVAATPPPPAPAPAPAPTPATAPAADGVVDIQTLCYTGRAALARAVEVRRQLQDVLAGRGGALRPLLDELLDLVDLATRPDA